MHSDFLIDILNNKLVILNLWLSISKGQNVVYALGLQVHSDFLITLYMQIMLNVKIKQKVRKLGDINTKRQIFVMQKQMTSKH